MRISGCRHLAGICTAVLLLAACAAPQTSAVLTDPGGLPKRAAVTGLPFHDYVDHQGAPAALAAALEWAGHRVAARSLAAELKGEQVNGSVVEILGRYGLLAYPVSDLRMLLTEVAAGHPVVVLQEPNGGAREVWRYAIVHGFDLDRGQLLVHSGAIRDMRLPMAVFEANWKRADHWAVAVVPAGEMPATADEARYLKAAATLADEGSPWDALIAHETALAVWPQSANAHLGLGRSLRDLGDRLGAAEAFRTAGSLEADSTVAEAELALLEGLPPSDASAAEMRPVALEKGLPPPMP